MQLSWIQKHILLCLVREKTARIKSLRPNDVEANLFSYHLNGLVTSGAIIKVAHGTYGLTIQGEKLVGQLSTATQAFVENIKTVILYWSQRDDATLLLRWTRQPYMGHMTLPYNRVPFGKSITEAIKDGLREKLGNEDASATYIASALIRIESSGVLVSHMNALIYKVDAEQLRDSFVGRNGELVWAELPFPNKLMNGVEDFLVCLGRGDRMIDSVWDYTE
jgi:hypothetical protein